MPAVFSSVRGGIIVTIRALERGPVCFKPVDRRGAALYNEIYITTTRLKKEKRRIC